MASEAAESAGLVKALGYMLVMASTKPVPGDGPYARMIRAFAQVAAQDVDAAQVWLDGNTIAPFSWFNHSLFLEAARLIHRSVDEEGLRKVAMVHAIRTCIEHGDHCALDVANASSECAAQGGDFVASARECEMRALA